MFLSLTGLHRKQEILFFFSFGGKIILAEVKNWREWIPGSNGQRVSMDRRRPLSSFERSLRPRGASVIGVYGFFRDRIPLGTPPLPPLSEGGNFTPVFWYFPRNSLGIFTNPDSRVKRNNKLTYILWSDMSLLSISLSNGVSVWPVW